MPSHIRVTSLAVLTFLAACADQPVTPGVRGAGPRLASSAACAASPTAVVHTDAELRTALASASAGDVIAISGNIPLDSVVVVATEGVTLTCAEPGAGLSFAPGNQDVLLELWAGHITVSGLKLDAEYGFSPILALSLDVEGFPNIRLTGNEIDCGYDFCIFASGVPNLEITDNHWKGDSTRFGLQIQGSGVPLPGGGFSGGSGVVISRNVIENEDGYLAIYGGIRVRQGRNVTITHNQILGSWSNGIVLTNVYDSRVEHNRIDGVLRDGIDLALIVANRVSISGVSFRGNQISNSGRAGISVRGACGNTFEGNNVEANPVGTRFEPTTGDNVYRGNPGVVQDGGAFDCDLDGDIDPNQISGVHPRRLTDTVPGPSAIAAQRAAGRRVIPAVW